jgi:hypothetical protein
MFFKKNEENSKISKEIYEEVCTDVITRQLKHLVEEVRSDLLERQVEKERQVKEIVDELENLKDYF